MNFAKIIAFTATIIGSNSEEVFEEYDHWGYPLIRFTSVSEINDQSPYTLTGEYKAIELDGEEFIYFNMDVGGATIPEGYWVLTWVTIEDSENLGNIEAFTCKRKYVLDELSFPEYETYIG